MRKTKPVLEGSASSTSAFDKGSASSSSAFKLYESGIIKVSRPMDNPTAPYAAPGEIPDYLSMIDHKAEIADKKAYERALETEERRLNILVRKLAAAKRSLIVVLQGRDGAGKSGATIRIAGALDHDAKLFRSVPIGAPTEDERARSPMDRFFKHERMPGYGQVRVFDRSWYEEVLVVRVNKIKPEPVWQSAYSSLRTLDWMLEAEGAIVVKIWMDISKGEQKKRFEDRARDKPWKLSPSDMEARKKWKHYTAAANEMFYQTGVDYAPWFLISSEDKRYSRVHALAVINQQLSEALGE